jgi:hypothetical protein
MCKGWKVMNSFLQDSSFEEEKSARKERRRKKIRLKRFNGRKDFFSWREARGRAF